MLHARRLYPAGILLNMGLVHPCSCWCACLQYCCCSAIGSLSLPSVLGCAMVEFVGVLNLCALVVRKACSNGGEAPSLRCCCCCWSRKNVLDVISLHQQQSDCERHEPRVVRVDCHRVIRRSLVLFLSEIWFSFSYTTAVVYTHTAAAMCSSHTFAKTSRLTWACSLLFRLCRVTPCCLHLSQPLKLSLSGGESTACRCG